MKTPKSTFSREETVKKSRFLVKVFPLSSPEEFPRILKEEGDPSANHNCWAWKVDNDYRFYDDGEPSGTAGKPIFQAIESQKWNNIAVLVIRYFGGIKLGAGGLIRAYNGTASRALQQTPFDIPVEMTILVISAAHEYTGNIYSLLKRFNIMDEEVTYTASLIILKIRIAQDMVKQFTAACINETSGNVSVDIQE